MLVSKIDYNMLAEVAQLKEVVRTSVEAVLDEKLTASHLATDVYKLLDLLDKLESEWKGTPPEDSPALATAQAAPVAAPPVEVPPVEAPPAEAPPVEAPPVEAVPAEASPAEVLPIEPPAEQAQAEEPATEGEES